MIRSAMIFSFFALLPLFLTGTQGAPKQESECCQEKRVGDIDYTLLSDDSFSGIVPEQCLNDCLYTVTGTSEPKFCFAIGELPFECLGSGFVQSWSGQPGGELEWETLASEVTIRHFSASNYFNSKDPATVWNEMGEDITCTIDPATLIPTLSLPSSFDPAKPMKLFTHGFMDTTIGGETLSKYTYFVNAWMDRYGGDYDVILVDWHDMAWPLQIESLNNYFYDLAARNSINVGEFVGRCLAGVIQQQGTGALHFSGHSLGAHLVGKIGRTIHEVTGQKVARVTGLDPAGPRFVDGPLLDAIPELHANLLSPDSAQFVDIIHTNGALEPAVFDLPPRAGALQQLGHMDFYPDGGSSQYGCTFGQDVRPGCSHGRSVLYFLWSIIDEDLFPSQVCTSVESCNNEESEGPTVAFMGEPAPQSFTGTRQLFYLDINDCHWDFDEHNSWLCMMGEPSPPPISVTETPLST